VLGESFLTIGDVTRRTRVAASALRYWEELGLLPAPARVSGRRRYPESVVDHVGVILLRRDAGFSLAEQKALAAREAIQHGLRCPHADVLDCPNFRTLVGARLDGQSLEEAHARLHASHQS
jgi:DNA-binding transcriptional MerR regulator